MSSMTRSRLTNRVGIFARAAVQSVFTWGRRECPRPMKRVLIAHNLLLGDTLMLTPLLAKLRQNHPEAEVVMIAPKPYEMLYRNRPYGVQALPFDPRGASGRVFERTGYDVALVPGDNRYSWLARAMGARWVIAFAGDRPSYKSWPVDELVAYPDSPAAWGDIVTTLVPGPAPPRYRPEDWPAPDCSNFALPRSPYCVLHVGASSPLKLWPEENWRAFAARLEEWGYAPVWSGGPGEERFVSAIDPRRRYPSYAGRLDLAQMWRMLAEASLLVCPDTGVAHLGRIVGTPTVAIFGPGSALLSGPGDFWRNSPFRAVTVPDFPCRDQHLVFKREIQWVKRCSRRPPECHEAACMKAISVDRVSEAAESLIRNGVSKRDTLACTGADADSADR